MNLGVMEWFEVGDHDHVERTLERMRRTGMRRIRVGVSWADWQGDGAESWYDRMLARLAEEVEVVPCFAGTPPSLGVFPRTSSPPREPKEFSAFVERMIERYGAHFEWIELWNQPHLAARWDRLMDPDWTEFGKMVAMAALTARRHGKRTLLGGVSPDDTGWLDLLLRRGVLEHVDAVGVHVLGPSEGWQGGLERVRHTLERHGAQAEVWVSEAGHSTWRHDDLRQVELAQDLVDLDVERVDWLGMEDPSPGALDDRQAHYGLWRTDGVPKLLAQVLQDGRDPRELRWLVEESLHAPGPGHVLVTGGAGFVGTNLVDRLLHGGHEVLVLDSLGRVGSLENLEWLRSVHGQALHVHVADVRDRNAVARACRGAKAVFHLAAQVAVTTSVEDPRSDFEVNAEGTFNLLDAVRHQAPEAFFLYASTNKVYGGMEHLPLVERRTRWDLRPGPFRREMGQQALSFATPYGCSKGAADQYVLDHARTFGMDATVFRMSCVYGPHQNGTEDQGWVVHFLRSAATKRPVTVYGDGKQLRDVLHVDDLVEAYLRAMNASAAVRGRAWDIGGGPENTVSIRELFTQMESLGCTMPEVRWARERPGDQKYYVADIRPLQQALGWSPTIPFPDGLRRVWEGLERPAQEVVA